MVFLLTVLSGPLMLLAMAALLREARPLTRAAALIAWAQFAAACVTLGPGLAGHGDLPHAVAGFRVDPISAMFLLLTMLVVASALTHAVGFFEREAAGEHAPETRHVRQFYVFTALFQLAMFAVISADNLGYLWISMEATTLASAPLVYYHRSRTSLEATWKYLLVCSVGIAFAFFGTAILYAASQRAPGLGEGSLSVSVLTAHARLLPAPLLRLSFIFMLLGYGTKAGLFPLHSWLPDAHSEAPAPASAMLSGALLNVALVALLRISGLMAAAGDTVFVRATLLPMAVLTVLFSSLFLLKQRDLKRMLAYSSMENVGLMATAISLGAVSGFTLQAINHSLVKVALFLLAGNMLQRWGTKDIRSIRGALRATPAQAALLLAGIVAIAGTPPFGSFLAEWQILSAAADGRHIIVVTTICIALAIAFIALTAQAAALTLGDAPPRKGDAPTAPASGASHVLIPGALVVLSLFLGLMLTPELVAIAGGVAR